ncbi:MAG: photosystem II reaction center PsbP family protein [Scytolyngbya sp. HA4215-MV1]|jgi:photosystem II oxygen-evolving enhancer protein 2|nr:photosystem II reaction center PsbP family protein [Scytolyngbya sp. HA4215-MV1]
MLKRVVALLLVVLSLNLAGCVSSVAGLKSYVDSIDGYQFLYPNGWLSVRVENGPDIVFHDLIETTENVSVVISPVPDKKKLSDLGSAGEVGYKLGKSAIAPPGSGREAELVTADEQQIGNKTYYFLEYVVKIGEQQRHNLASVAVSRGKLFTLNVSTTEQRWEKMQDSLKQVVSSFSVY